MLDFEKEFSSFQDNGGGSHVMDIYSIIPSYSSEEQLIINDLYYFIEKYELKDLDSYLKRFMKNRETNKSLGFFSNMQLKTLLAASTGSKLIFGDDNASGVKVQNQNRRE